MLMQILSIVIQTQQSPIFIMTIPVGAARKLIFDGFILGHPKLLCNTCIAECATELW